MATNKQKKKKEKKKGDRAQKGEKEVKDSLYIFESYSVSLFPSFWWGGEEKQASDLYT